MTSLLPPLKKIVTMNLSVITLLSLMGASIAAVPTAFVAPRTRASPSSAILRFVHQNVDVHDDNGDDAVGGERRDFLRSALAAAAAAASAPLTVLPALAASEKLDTYEMADYGLKIDVPSAWVKSEQSLPDRRKIVLFVDPVTGVEGSGGDDKTLLFAAYTPVRDDFTSLGSFGSVESVGQMTILPKGSVAMEETESVMISAESKKNAYIFDYTCKVPDQPKVRSRLILISCVDIFVRKYSFVQTQDIWCASPLFPFWTFVHCVILSATLSHHLHPSAGSNGRGRSGFGDVDGSNSGVAIR